MPQPSARVGRSATERGTSAGAAPNGFDGRSICETSACGRSAMTPTTSCVGVVDEVRDVDAVDDLLVDDELDLRVPLERRRLRVEEVELVRAGREADRGGEPGVALRCPRPSAARPGSTGPTFWRSTSIAAHEPDRAWPWRRIRAFIVTDPACCAAVARASGPSASATMPSAETSRTMPFAPRDLLVP